MAIFFLTVAKQHLGSPPALVTSLKGIWKKTRPLEKGMGKRTIDRFRQFEGDNLLDAYLALPAKLMSLALKTGKVDVHSAKLVRMALFMALLQDTAARSGNLTGLNLKTQILNGTDRKNASLFIVIAGSEVKNGVGIRTPLEPATAKIFRRYVDVYRGVHGDPASDWLFPRRDAKHWTTAQAGADFKDCALRHLGTVATPHLCRSLAGLAVLKQRPDAYPLVQQLLGHKRLETTIAFYTHLEPDKVRAAYHAILHDRAKARRL